MLWNLFPDDSFPQDSTYPLSAYDFRETILLPEAAIALIMQDMDIDHSKARRVMVDSARYGTNRFPHTDEEDYDALVAAAFSGDSDPFIKERSTGRWSIPSSEVSYAGTVNVELPPSSDLVALDAEISRSGTHGLNSSEPGLDPVPNTACTARSPSAQSGPSTFSSEYVRSRLRRRRLPRSSIPDILGNGADDSDVGSEDIPTSKRARRI